MSIWDEGPPDGTIVFEAVTAEDILSWTGPPTEWRKGVIFRDALNHVWVALPAEIPQFEQNGRKFDLFRYSDDTHFASEREAIAQTIANLEEASVVLASAIDAMKKEILVPVSLDTASQ